MTTTRLPLGRAHMLASSAIRDIRRAGLPASSVVPVGSLRRFSPDVGDVTLLGVAPAAAHAEVLTGFGRLPLVTAIGEATETRLTAITTRGPITLQMTIPEQAGAAMAWHTGSRRHTDSLAARAERLALQFSDARLRRHDGGDVPTQSESDLYRTLGLPYIPPELRDSDEAIAIAESGTLPELIGDAHIRGDLHVHSTWSDGRDSIEAMVLAARQLGYEYVAITDHSERAWSSRKLAAEDVPRQREEIAALREAITGIEILHGVEVDIMKDGSLDFDDALLERFDIVLASLHDHGGQEGAQLTQRYLRAIRHPLVNVITHPANRSPAQSSGYDVEFDQLFAAAAETGTAMEIDGAPGHLDMDGSVARRAATAGVTITVDSDCHRADSLARQMRFGIGTARRGWIEPQHVLNTRSVEAVREFVARKRAGR